MGLCLAGTMKVNVHPRRGSSASFHTSIYRALPSLIAVIHTYVAFWLANSGTARCLPVLTVTPTGNALITQLKLSEF